MTVFQIIVEAIQSIAIAYLVLKMFEANAILNALHNWAMWIDDRLHDESKGQLPSDDRTTSDEPSIN